MKNFKIALSSILVALTLSTTGCCVLDPLRLLTPHHGNEHYNHNDGGGHNGRHNDSGHF